MGPYRSILIAVGIRPTQASFSQKFCPIPTRANCIPGNGILRPETLAQRGWLIGPGDRHFALGDSTSSRQPAELSGFFKPKVVMPVRGDWLVVDAVGENQAATSQLPANRENNREFFDFRLFRRKLARKTHAILEGYEQIPYELEQGIESKEQGISKQRTGNFMTNIGVVGIPMWGRECGRVEPNWL